MDALITAGIANSRAEAIRWAVGRIREHAAYPQPQERLYDIDEPKAQFQRRLMLGWSHPTPRLEGADCELTGWSDRRIPPDDRPNRASNGHIQLFPFVPDPGSARTARVRSGQAPA